jgi:hypothetical protein
LRRIYVIFSFDRLYELNLRTFSTSDIRLLTFKPKLTNELTKLHNSGTSQKSLGGSAVHEIPKGLPPCSQKILTLSGEEGSPLIHSRILQFITQVNSNLRFVVVCIPNITRFCSNL